MFDTIGRRFTKPRLEKQYSTESMADNVAEEFGISRED